MDELYKNLVKLKPKDNVPFKCIGCGECCKHVKEQVPVETLDAFRIARYLMEQDKSITCMDDFWERYAEPALLDECGYFVYFLKTKGPDDACIFLENNRCKIHAVNPRACRTYPFIAGPLENGGYEYLISYERKQHFNGPKVHTKTWMKKRFTHEDQAFLGVDFSILTDYIEGVEKIKGTVAAVLYHGTFKVIIPAEEAINPPNDYRGKDPIAVHRFVSFLQLYVYQAQQIR